MGGLRAVVLLIVGTTLLAGGVSLGINIWAKSQSPTGCQSVAGDGRLNPTQTIAFWNNQPIEPLTALADNLGTTDKKVLGANSSDKWIEVDLGKQKLIAHRGDQVFLESLISSGLWNKTPLGEYHIWYKTTATLMEGGSKANNTYYYLPNVPFSMFFYKDYGIHGTYWHHNFGHPMSHGCVNAPTPVAEKLFYWTDPQLPSGKYSVQATADNPGTRVVVHQ